MAYIGQNADGNFTTSVSKDTFSGNGSTTAFTLSEAATTNTVDVFVENIRQEPTTAYTVDGTTLTFTAAPVSGTDNIYVVNRGPIQLSASHPAAQALTAYSATITTDLTVDTNVLVGKTSQTIDTVGAELLGSIGKVHATRDGGASAGFNRLSDDGDIAVFYKDGSSVGSIGSRGGGTSFITLKTTSGAGAGLTGSDNRILPMDESALADNNTDLGMSSYRFKDLYLGGSVYLGGTGSANALDDYEEGTWTPTYYIAGATFSMGLQVGRYVKIGRMVHATARVRGQRSGGSGVLLLTGLPFTTESTTNINAACSIGFTNGWSTSPKGAITGNNATSISFRKSGSTSALSNIVDDITHSDVSTSSTSSNDLILSVTYRTA